MRRGRHNTAGRILGSALALLGSAAAHADSDHERAKMLRDAGDILSLEVIIGKAKAIHPGRVLETELEKKSAGYVYEIELVDDQGRVWKMKFDAARGTPLDTQGDD